jgi:hypothetical protein
MGWSLVIDARAYHGAVQPHYSPQQLARMWGFKAEYIRSFLKGEPGVLRLRKILRVPHSRLDDIFSRLSLSESPERIYVLNPLGTDFIKVGYAKRNWVGRVNGLQVGWPVDLVVVALFSGDKQLEESLHSLLERFRIRGEWFRHCRESVAAIESFAAHRRVPIPDCLALPRQQPTVKGVCFNSGSWLVRADGKYIGRYKSRNEAIQAYNAFARLNFPDAIPEPGEAA